MHRCKPRIADRGKFMILMSFRGRGRRTPATAATLGLQLIINHFLLITSYSGVTELDADAVSVAAAALA